jgi:hypothetical protein
MDCLISHKTYHLHAMADFNIDAGNHLVQENQWQPTINGILIVDIKETGMISFLP